MALGDVKVDVLTAEVSCRMPATSMGSHWLADVDERADNKVREMAPPSSLYGKLIKIQLRSEDREASAASDTAASTSVHGQPQWEAGHSVPLRRCARRGTGCSVAQPLCSSHSLRLHTSGWGVPRSSVRLSLPIATPSGA